MKYETFIIIPLRTAPIVTIFEQLDVNVKLEEKEEDETTINPEPRAEKPFEPSPSPLQCTCYRRNS